MPANQWMEGLQRGLSSSRLNDRKRVISAGNFHDKFWNISQAVTGLFVLHIIVGSRQTINYLKELVGRICT